MADTTIAISGLVADHLKSSEPNNNNNSRRKKNSTEIDSRNDQLNRLWLEEHV